MSWTALDSTYFWVSMTSAGLKFHGTIIILVATPFTKKFAFSMIGGKKIRIKFFFFQMSILKMNSFY